MEWGGPIKSWCVSEAPILKKDWYIHKKINKKKYYDTKHFRLNIDEFLAFTHPESSHSILAQQTEETLGRFDGDGDGVITLEEYVSDPYIEFTPDELKDRQNIFHSMMDADGNGKVDRRELITYLDPKVCSK